MHSFRHVQERAQLWAERSQKDVAAKKQLASTRALSNKAILKRIKVLEARQGRIVRSKNSCAEGRRWGDTLYRSSVTSLQILSEEGDPALAREVCRGWRYNTETCIFTCPTPAYLAGATGR